MTLVKRADALRRVQGLCPVNGLYVAVIVIGITSIKQKTVIIIRARLTPMQETNQDYSIPTEYHP